MVSSKKPALIFVHGFRGNPSGLKQIANSFPDYQVFLPSIPPFGDSKPLEKYDTRSYVDFIVNFIEKNRLEKPILIGHSLGSIIVSAVAANSPEKINNKLILLAPMSSKPNKFIAILQPLVVVIPNKIIGWLCTMYLGKQNNNKKQLKEILRLTYDAGSKYTSKKDVAASAKFSASVVASEFNFEKDALFISGAKENLVPKKATEKFAKKVHAKTIYLENTGHLLNYEEPEKTAKAIREFLNQ